jgi:dipicolinate synthase subunit A
MSLGGRKIAIVGGDEREQEIARLAATTGASVTVYGIPWPDGGIAGVTPAHSAEAALEGADYALFPIPGIAADGSLFAPAAASPIMPDLELLSHMAPGAHIALGAADERLRAAAESCGIALMEYEDDRELMLLRGPAIVEGVIAAAVANTRVTIHRAPVVVVGYGTIGGLLARTLAAIGAQVTVAARNPTQRAGAYASGHDAISLAELRADAGRFSMVFSTVPARVVDEAVLAQLPPGSLVVDIAAPPGGVDLARAEELGHVAVWARGMGRRAPITVGASQWQGIRSRLEQVEAARRG